MVLLTFAAIAAILVAGSLSTPSSRYRSARVLMVAVTGVDALATDVFAMSPDGSQWVNLTHTPRAAEALKFDPAWSPNGKRIVFSALANVHAQKADLYAINADGSGRQRLTDLPSHSIAGSPTWSPDGQRIAFSVAWCSPDWEITRVEIWVLDTADGTVRLLGPGCSPDWSPNGRWILHTRFRSGADPCDASGPDLWRMDTSANNAERLVANADDGRWSPDGQRIAYRDSFPDACGNPTSQGIFVVSAEGRNPRHVSDESPSELADDVAPLWSADGKQLIYTELSGAPFWPETPAILRVDVPRPWPGEGKPHCVRIGAGLTGGGSYAIALARGYILGTLIARPGALPWFGRGQTSRETRNLPR